MTNIKAKKPSAAKPIKQSNKAAKKPHEKALSVVSPEVYAKIYRGLEEMRDEKGAFLASLSDDYRACWIRDQLYANFAYLYTKEEKKFIEGIRVVFDILHQQFDKIEFRICYPPMTGDEHIHAKYHIENYAEVTPDWGHHQVDAIGLFLFCVALAYENNMLVFVEGVAGEKDRELLQLLVNYLTAVRYWEKPDNGMWEEWMELHTSSIGAAVKGLSLIKKHKLAYVPDSLIRHGIEQLFNILPNETPGGETPGREQDLAQLSLIWPYELLPKELEEIVLYRIKTRLLQMRGLNRYLGDNYYRSANGVSAEWTFGFFWLSIVACERGNIEEATFWLNRGLSTMTNDGFLPELYQNDEPNINTPLAWSHAMALIAIHKIEEKHQTPNCKFQISNN